MYADGLPPYFFGSPSTECGVMIALVAFVCYMGHGVYGFVRGGMVRRDVLLPNHIITE